ncbi:hypothetical protein BDN67DRAFT_119302 [Paxillus ammoniavirescens]|nr:hypothetical protein BDN67DRAFT_119302 [Paxillus ammoniavirescens]
MSLTYSLIVSIILFNLGFLARCHVRFHLVSCIQCNDPFIRSSESAHDHQYCCDVAILWKSESDQNQNLQIVDTEGTVFVGYNT